VSFTRWVTIYGPTYATALVWTAITALAAACGAIVWGCLLLLLRLSGGGWGARAVDGYVQLFRNTPVLLPIYLIYFAFPLIGLPWPAVVCGTLALILQNGAYVSEILRGSVNAIDRVQFDAARSIGLAPWSTFRKIVLLLKDTSLLSAISITELTMQAKLLTEQTGAAYEAFIVVAVLYLVLVSGTEVAFRVTHRAVRWL